jgi:hypothetical protein
MVHGQARNCIAEFSVQILANFRFYGFYKKVVVLTRQNRYNRPDLHGKSIVIMFTIIDADLSGESVWEGESDELSSFAGVVIHDVGLFGRSKG